MRILDRYLLKLFVPAFFGALVFFVLLLELVEMFSSFWKYLNAGAGTSQLFSIYALYAPKCASYGIPIAMLFAVSFSMGQLYSKNELISVFGSGIPLTRFVSPFLILGVLVSVGAFFFEDNVVVVFEARRAALSQTLLKTAISFSQSDVDLLSRDGLLIYHAELYNDEQQSLSGVMLLERTSDGFFVARINAESAKWSGDRWVLRRARRFFWNEDASSLTERSYAEYSQENFSEPPSSFRKVFGSIQEMSTADAQAFIERLKKNTYLGEVELAGYLVEYYKKYFFHVTPFVVAMISASIGGRFRKNILLLSLLASIVLAGAFYILQMLSSLFASSGSIPPLASAVLPLGVYAALGIALFARARS